VGEITLREAQAVLDEELSQLPERLRTPLVLCYLEGLTQDQAARQAGWALRTFKRRLWQGKDLLHRRLQRRGVALSAVLSGTLLCDTELTAAALLGHATRTAVAFRAQRATSAEAARAAVLAEGFLKTLGFKRLRNTVTLLLTAALAVGGLSAQVLTPPNALIEPPVEARRDGQPAARPVDAEEPVRLDTFGWHHGLRAVTVSPDGKTLASAGNDGLVKLWTLETRKQVRTLPAEPDPAAHEWSIESVAFSADGKTLASGCVDRTIRLWDVATGKEKGVLRGHTVFVQSVAFSPDGTTLASASGGPPLAFKTIKSFREFPTKEEWFHRGEVKVWDLATGTDRTLFSAGTGRITAVAFSPDGTTLVSSGWDGAVRLWDLRTGRERACLRDGEHQITCAAFSPDGKTLAAAFCLDAKKQIATGNRPDPQRHAVTLWDPASGRVRARLGGHTSWVQAVAFSPDGRILATASNGPAPANGTESPPGEVRLWDAATLKPIGAPLTCPHPGAALAFGAGGKILAAAGPRLTGPGEMTLWALRTRGDRR
jgi:WD40 repeat protein